MVRGEPDEAYLVHRVPLTQELAHVDEAVPCHVGGAGVADMGVVLPHEALRAGPEVPSQPLDRVGHVVVTDVPRLTVAAHHRPVVPLRAGGDLGVLCRVEGVLVVRWEAPGATPAPRRAGGPRRSRTTRSPGGCSRRTRGGLRHKGRSTATPAARPVGRRARAPRAMSGSRAASPTGSRRRARRTPPGCSGGLSALCPRSQVRNSATSRFAHIQVGQRSNRASSSSASRSSSPRPRTQRFSRQQSGQSPSTPIHVKPCSSMRRRLSCARHQ